MKRLMMVAFREATTPIEQHLGEAPVVRHRDVPQLPDQQKREEIRGAAEPPVPSTPDDHDGRYLFDRTGITVYPYCLCCAPDKRHVEAGSRPSWHPMPVAKVWLSGEAVANGERGALHRTWLDAHVGKARWKAAQEAEHDAHGAAVRLMEYDDVLGIAEASRRPSRHPFLFRVPCWTALTAGLLETWVPQATVKTIYIFGDNDEGNTSQAAAYALARRLEPGGLRSRSRMSSAGTGAMSTRANCTPVDRS